MKPFLFSFFCLFALSASFHVNAQCPGADIVLSSQMEVNDFPANFPGCSSPGFNIRVEGPDIVNLNGLSGLATPAADIEIRNNPILTDISGLSGITSIGGDFRIALNNSLPNLDGLSNLSSVGGVFQLASNPSLMNIDGVSNLTNIGQDIIINTNVSLINLDGLSGIVNHPDRIQIANNSSLTNLNSLSNLVSVGGGFSVQDNDMLTDISGLSNIVSIGGPLRLELNDQLADCCGLFPVINNGGVAGSVIVMFNLPGCNTEAEIIAGGACPAPAVPTLGEWGMIFLVLITLNLGILFIAGRKQKLVLAGESVNLVHLFSQIPFDSKTFGRILIGTLFFAVCVFIVAVSAFGYNLTNSDIPGLLVCTPVLAYLIYLITLGNTSRG